MRLIEGAHGRTPSLKGAQRLQWYETGERPSDPWLSPREQEILLMLAEDLTEPEIAERLSLSTHTVRQHTRHMRDRFGKRRMLAVYAEAARRGLLGKRYITSPVPVQALLTSKQVMARLGISRSTLSRWCKSGRLRRVEFGGKLMRFDPDEVDQFLHAHRGE